MLRRILVPLDPSSYCDAAVEQACAVGRRHGAPVTGLTMLDVQAVAAYVGPAPVGGLHYATELHETEEQAAHEALRAVLLRFRSRCSGAGVAHRCIERRGDSRENILYEAMFHDLVVIGLRTHFRFATSDEPDGTLEQILDRCVAPIYAVPDVLPVSEELRVLVPFDGSLRAARALHHMVQVIDPSACATTTLLTCHEDEATGRTYLDAGAAYVTAHGFGSVETVWQQGDVISTVVERYLGDADLIVLGAHSQRKLVELFVGSLTNTLISEATTPLLIG